MLHRNKTIGLDRGLDLLASVMLWLLKKSIQYYPIIK